MCSTTPTGCGSTTALHPRRRGATTPWRSSKPHARPACAASSTSASPTRPRTRRWSTSAARPAWSAPWRESGLVLRHPAADGAVRQGRHPDQQHRLGAAPVCRSSACSATAATGCSRSTWTIWPRWRWREGGAARTRDHQRHRAGDLHLPGAGGDDRPDHRQAAADRVRAAGRGLLRPAGCSAHCVGDVIITREEIAGLMADLLYVETSPTGETKLTDWITAHADTLGRRYTSELARRVDRAAAYRSN